MVRRAARGGTQRSTFTDGNRFIGDSRFYAHVRGRLLAAGKWGCHHMGMTREQILGEANALSSQDRLALAIDLWDSVENDAEFLPLSTSHIVELDRRLDGYLADPSDSLPAEETLKELEREFQ